MKVCISNTRFCFYLAFYLYKEIDFGVHMTGLAVIRIRVWGFSVDDDCMVPVFSKE